MTKMTKKRGIGDRVGHHIRTTYKTVYVCTGE